MAAGSRTFITGQPCRRGHHAERYASSGQCVECRRIVKARHHERNKATINSRARERAKDTRRPYVRRDRSLYLARRAQNPEAAKAHARAYSKQRRDKDPAYAMAVRMRARVTSFLKRCGLAKSDRTSALLGCTFSEFKTHIERQFLPGMTWANRAEWHLDHIVALSRAKDAEELKTLFRYTNVRPIWGSANMSKGASFTHLL